MHTMGHPAGDRHGASANMVAAVRSADLPAGSASSLMVRRVLLGAAASRILLAAAGCGSTGVNHDMDTGVSGQPGTGAMMHNDADVMFAQMMIPHHRQAVEMATLAETRGHDSELKNL